MSYESARLLQEKYEKWLHAPIGGFIANPISVSKSAGSGGSFVGLILNVWKCTITSAPDSIWREGSYDIELRFPQECSGSMVIYFKPPIFHPNVNMETGLVLCPVVRESWVEVDIAEVLLSLRYLLDHPKLYTRPHNEYAMKVFWHHYERYKRIVRLNIIEYHSGPVCA